MRKHVSKIRRRPEDAHQSSVEYIEGVGYTMCLYRTKNGERLRWPAAFPLPNLNDRVRVKMCEIGDATVVGFFREPGELGWVVGVIVRTDAPLPNGLKGHTLQRDGQLYLHGTEFQPIQAAYLPQGEIMPRKKHPPIRPGDVLNDGLRDWKVLRTLPGGKLDLCDEKRCVFAMFYFREVAAWKHTPGSTS